jgi:hypothetical protein
LAALLSGDVGAIGGGGEIKRSVAEDVTFQQHDMVAGTLRSTSFEDERVTKRVFGAGRNPAGCQRGGRCFEFFVNVPLISGQRVRSGFIWV